MPLTVAIIGRPNVGKSTLFNRLVGKRIALVDDQPGVTRDRRDGEATLGDLSFRIVDTAGLEEADDADLGARMLRQTENAIDLADICLFLVDARAGITPDDAHFAKLLRRKDKRVVLVANKCEGERAEAGLLEAFSLGFGEPIALSAEHGVGLETLYSTLAPIFDTVETEADEEEDDERPIRVAVVGRPNVGKSTLINQLVGEERLITGPEAGITRDSIDLRWEWQGRSFKLYDTAGMRRRAKVTQKLEKLSVNDTLRAIRFAEVVLVVLDATTSFEHQDLHILDLVEREGRALVCVANKWDLMEEPDGMLRAFRDRLHKDVPQFGDARLVALSALFGQGVKKLMPQVVDAYEQWNKRIDTAPLNQWLLDVIQKHPPPASKGRRIRLRYMTQINVRPPTFAVFTSQPKNLPASYRRYLVNELRSAFDLEGLPIRLMLRKGDNPYRS